MLEKHEIFTGKALISSDIERNTQRQREMFFFFGGEGGSLVVVIGNNISLKFI